MPREQGESGEFVETIAPEDVLDVFDAVDGPVILSADVADHFEVTRETARRKLKQLSDRGVLDRRKVSRRVIYWRADGGGFDAVDLRGDPSTTLDDTDAERTATTPGRTDPTETTSREKNAESGRTRDESDAVDLPPEDAVDDATRAVVDDAAETWEDDARLPNRKHAAMAVVQYAIDSGDAVGKSHPVVDAARDAYPVDGQNRETYWRKNVRPVLKTVGDYSRATKGYTVDGGDL